MLKTLFDTISSFISAIFKVLSAIWDIILNALDKLTSFLFVILVTQIIFSFIGFGVFFNFISGDSMEPTQGTGIAFTLLYPGLIDDLQRGQIVATNHERDLIMKRAVGVPGDVIYQSGCTLTVNDEDVLDKYNIPCDYYFYKRGQIDLTDNQIWVIGDNYEHSYDSGRFGPLTPERLEIMLISFTINNDGDFIINTNNNDFSSIFTSAYHSTLKHINNFINSKLSSSL